MLALFCSAKALGSIILQIHDLAQQWRTNGVTITSGFHSPVEQECLAVLWRGPGPVMVCPARGLVKMRLKFVSRYALCQAGPPTNSLKPAAQYVTEAGNVRGYRPDFLIERIDGAKEPHRFPLHWKELHEVKGGQFISNPNTIRKHEAARNWCKKRGMRFVVITK